MKWLIQIIIIMIFCFSVWAKDHYGDLTHAEYVRNYDGDTITFNIHYIHPLIGHNISVRVNGIDTPEIRAKCEQEKIMAVKAKEFVKSLCINAKRIDLRNIERGKYFRIVADVYIDGVNLTDILLEQKLGVSYDGGKKIDFCKNNYWLH